MEKLLPPNLSARDTEDIVLAGGKDRATDQKKRHPTVCYSETVLQRAERQKPNGVLPLCASTAIEKGIVLRELASADHRKGCSCAGGWRSEGTQKHDNVSDGADNNKPATGRHRDVDRIGG